MTQTEPIQFKRGYVAIQTQRRGEPITEMHMSSLLFGKGVFAIHKPPGKNPEGYRLTHVPTGLPFCGNIPKKYLATQKEAKELAKKLISHLGTDTSRFNTPDIAINTALMDELREFVLTIRDEAFGTTRES